MSDNVIVVGKRSITPDEYDSLHLVGYAIAHVGKALHTTPTDGAPLAVAEGYKAAGGEPTLHTHNLSQVDGETICVLDKDLATRLDIVLPGWDERRTWTTLHFTDEIHEFASIVAGWLEATGRSLVESGSG